MIASGREMNQHRIHEWSSYIARGRRLQVQKQLSKTKHNREVIVLE